MIKELCNVRKFKNAYTKVAEVGKWYKFEPNCPFGDPFVGFGKITRILDNGQVEVEKYFELPTNRQNYGWYDSLPYAI